MPPFDLPDIPIESYTAYVADRFRHLTQPVIDAFGTQRDPSIQAVYDQVKPENRLYVDQAVGAAQRAGVNPVLYVKQIQQESGFNPTAGSNEGAHGIAQFTDATAKGYGIDPYNPSQALDAGARYMASSLAQNGGDYRLALAAYNAGQGNVNRYGQRIFDPQYLRSQGWSEEDANQPARYIQSILGGNSVPAANPTAPTAPLASAQLPHSPAPLPGAVPGTAAPSFKDFSDGLLHQFSQGLGLNGGSQLSNDAGTSGRNVPQQDGRLSSMVENGSANQQSPAPSFADWSNGLIQHFGQASAPPTSPAAPSGYNDMAGASSSSSMSPASSSFGGQQGDNNSPDLSPTLPNLTPSTVGTAALHAVQAAPSFADWSSDLINRFGQATGLAGTPPSPSGYDDMAGAQSAPSVHPGASGPSYNDMVGANSNGQGSGVPSLTSLDSAPAGIQTAGTPGTRLGAIPGQIGQAIGNAAQQVGNAAQNELVRESQDPDVSSPGALLAKGVLGFGGMAAANRAEVERAYNLPRGPEREAALNQIGLNTIMSMGGAGEVGNAAEQAAAKVARPLVDEAGQTLGGVARDVAGDVTRMYHGTGSAFQTPDGAKFDPNGLFGPGYYLTSDPRVASSYAGMTAGSTKYNGIQRVADLENEIKNLENMQRQGLEPAGLMAGTTPTATLLQRARQQLADISAAGGPNVRAVNVPKGLNLLNADGPVTTRDVGNITYAISRKLGMNEVEAFEDVLPKGTVTGSDVWEALNPTGESDSRLASSILRDAGYDGIAYDGGKRIPLTDDAGQSIQHQAVVIFPASLPKIRNAISGTTMGSPPMIGGGVLGAAYGATQGDTPEERAKNALAYGVGGALGGHVLGGGKLPVGMSIADAGPRQTISEALTAARFGWQKVSQIAKDLGVDVSSHETFLPMEIETMGHAPGTAPAALRETELYNQYTASVVDDALKQIRPQIEQLSTEVAGKKEAAYPELTRLAKGLTTDNGMLRELVPLKQWQSLTGDVRTLAPNALVKQRGTVYVRPEYALDDIYSGEEAALKFGKSFDNLGDFQKAMYQARTGSVGTQEQIGQLKDLTAKEQALQEAYHAALPEAQLHDDLTAATAQPVRPIEEPLAGNQTSFAGTSSVPPPPSLSRAEERLAQARGTPEQQAQLRSPEADHAVNLLLNKFPAEQRFALQPLADAYGEFAGQRRGVQSDAVAAANAQRGLGMSVADFLKSPPGRAFNNEQIIALGNTAVHYQNQVTALTRALDAAKAAGTNTPQMEADLLTKSLEANALISVLSGGTAEAGRALRAVRTILTGDYAVSAKASGLAAKRFGVDPAELARQVGPSEAPGVGGVARPAKEAGLNVPPPLSNLTPGRPMTAAEMQALKDSGAAGIQPELLSQLANGKELTPSDIQQIRDSATANRQGDLGLNASATGGGSNAQRLAAAYKAMGTDGKAFSDWMTAWNMTRAEDTAGRYKLLQALTKPSLMDKVLTFGISNMLSSTKTGEIIGMHGAIMALNRPLLTVIRGDPLDAVANVVGQTRSIGSAWSNAVEALKTGVGPTTAEATLRGGNLEVRPDAFPGTSGLIMTPTLRVINAMHEFFRTTATAGALSEAARREALTSGRTVSDLLAHPTPKMLKFADDIAEQALHGGTPSTPAQLILQARNLAHTDITGKNFNAQNVGKVATGLTANLLLPFVKIPDYLYRNGAKIATGPVYYAATAATHAARGETAQAISDLRMWGAVSLLWGGILGEAIAGNVTGSGPTDPTKLALLKEARDPATGQPAWQAHSTRVPGPGGYRWVDNNVFGPLAIPLNALASAVETYRMEGIKPDVTPTAFMLGVANNTAKSMLDASYIRTAGQFFSAVMQGQGASAIAKTTGSNIVSRFIPLVGAAGEVARGLDPGVKVPSGPAQQIEARLPVLSRNVPNEVSPYGQSLENRQDAVSTLSPAITSTSGTVNAAANEVARLNQAGQAVNVRVFPSTQQKGGGVYAGASQSPEQIRTLQSALGQNAQRYITQEMSRPAYQQLSDTDKAKALNRALATADQQATLGASSSINQTDRQKALTAWAQVPHYTGVAGTPAQIADKNLQIEKAKGDLADYTKKYGSREMGMYHLMRDNREALNLALRQSLPSTYLKYRQKVIDTQYGGALSQALSQGTIDANQVLPVGSGG